MKRTNIPTKRTDGTKRTQGYPVVKKCKGCILVDETYNTCIPFLDPDYQHRNGKKCWGRCESIVDVLARMYAIKTYSAGTDDVIIKEWNYWRERAGFTEEELK